MPQRVVVGLSGGVDSSVAALLLLEQGYEVIGMFMKNWHDTSVTISDDCPWEEDSKDALLVAEKLGIPFQTIDLSEAYHEKIVEYMFSEYESGRTPNPDVLCNREIKFDVFLKTALSLGADFVATGHYCRKSTTLENGKTVHHLLSGMDKGKDQSYFLCQVNQDQLSKSLFPIGHLQKKEVRALAAKHGLITADKRDSQGLCFIGKVKLPDFLQQKLAVKEGKIILVPEHETVYARPETSLDEMSKAYAYTPDMGMETGTHKGAHFFTIGQRKGLQVGGMKEPLFVIGTDVHRNIVYVGMGEHHPGLYRKALFIQESDVHWVNPEHKTQVGDTVEFKCRIRYRQELLNVVIKHDAKGLFLLFDEPVRGITPGQFAAWYLNDELIGSGVIN